MKMKNHRKGSFDGYLRYAQLPIWTNKSSKSIQAVSRRIGLKIKTEEFWAIGIRSGKVEKVIKISAH